MAEFNSSNVNGKATAGLTTGIIGTAGWLLNGGLGNLFGGLGGGNGSEKAISRYDQSKEAEITQLKMEKALLESNIYTDQKLADVYERLSGRIRCVENELSSQAVINAKSDAAIACISGQVSQLYGLTKLIVPASSVCPQPMPQYNSWTAPTAPTGA